LDADLPKRRTQEKSKKLLMEVKALPQTTFRPCVSIVLITKSLKKSYTATLFRQSESKKEQTPPKRPRLLNEKPD